MDERALRYATVLWQASSIDQIEQQNEGDVGGLLIIYFFFFINLSFILVEEER